MFFHNGIRQVWPPIACYGVFLVSQHGQLGAIPPPPFLSIGVLESMRSEGVIPTPPPYKRGISAILARYPMKTRQNACDTPLCDTISKGYCAIWGASRIGPEYLSFLKPLASSRQSRHNAGTFFNRLAASNLLSNSQTLPAGNLLFWDHFREKLKGNN